MHLAALEPCALKKNLDNVIVFQFGGVELLLTISFPNLILGSCKIKLEYYLLHS